MECLIKNSKTIDRYSVKFEVNDLLALKSKLLKDCSVVEHYDYDAYNLIPGHNAGDIRNYKQTEITPKSYYYHFTYDLVKRPYIVKLINKLLQDNSEAIPEIFCPDMRKELTELDGEKRRINSDIAVAYFDLQKVIQLDLISSLPLGELSNVAEFFGLSMEEAYNTLNNTEDKQVSFSDRIKRR